MINIKYKRFNIKDNFKNLIYVFKWCIKLSINVSPIYTAIRIISELLNPLINITGVYISKYLIDIISVENSNIKITEIKILLFFMALIAILKAVVIKSTIYANIMHSEMLNNYMTKNMMEYVLEVDLEYFDNPNFQNKYTSAVRDGQTLIQALGSSISAVSSLLSLIISFIILAKVSLVYAIIMIFVAIPSGIAMKYYTESIYELSIEQVSKRRKLSYIQGLSFDTRFSQDIRLFGSKDILKQKYIETWNKLFNEKKSILKRKTVSTLILDFIPELTLVIFSGIIIFRIINGELTIGDYVFLTGLFTQLWFSTSGFISSAMEIIENKLRMRNYQSLFSYVNKIVDDGVKELAQVNSIEFRNVSFKYPLSNKYALKNISFYCRKPEHVAFVGLNGSGKTTLIKLLLRFYAPIEGKILVNNIDIKEYKLDSLRKAFSVYFQDMQNFLFTIKDNFALTNPYIELNEKQIGTALRNGDMEYILNLESKGLETYISKYFQEDGIILSGGQIQKLALARVLYRDSSVLVLDEVSSNLDPEAENRIFDKLKLITRDRLTIFTSHRLSNLSLADRVIVLEDGKIIEDGSPNELLKKNGRYAELFKYQQKKYMVNRDGKF